MMARALTIEDENLFSPTGLLKDQKAIAPAKAIARLKITRPFPKQKLLQALQF